MKMNITKSAECKICDTETSEGVVLVKSASSHSAIYVGMTDLQSFDAKDGYGEELEFVCNSCLQELSAASLIQFVKDDFTVRKEPEDHEILEAMRELMLEKGYTTTLNVKQHLRNNGFWITQSRVHDLMELECEDDESSVERISIRYMNYAFYYDSEREFSTQVGVGSAMYSFNCSPTPVHVYYQIIGAIRMVWEVSKEEVYDSFVGAYSYDDLEEIINTGCSQRSWDDFLTLNYELKEIVMETVND